MPRPVTSSPPVLEAARFPPSSEDPPATLKFIRAALLTIEFRSVVAPLPESCNVPPWNTRFPPPARAEELARPNVPAASVVAPVYVLLALNMTEPEPLTVTASVPELPFNSAPLTSVLPAPRKLTVRVPVTPATLMAVPLDKVNWPASDWMA